MLSVPGRGQNERFVALGGGDGEGEREEVAMGLVDWLRGGSRERDLPRDAQEERLDVVSEEQEGARTESPGDLEPTVDEKRDAEAMRHHGI